MTAERIVAPFVGAWIEILVDEINGKSSDVAPFVGAWIEITYSLATVSVKSSLRSSERGLKYDDYSIRLSEGRSLRSSERGLKFIKIRPNEAVACRSVRRSVD